MLLLEPTTMKHIKAGTDGIPILIHILHLRIFSTSADSVMHISYTLMQNFSCPFNKAWSHFTFNKTLSPIDTQLRYYSFNPLAIQITDQQMHTPPTTPSQPIHSSTARATATAPPPAMSSSRKRKAEETM